MDINNIRVGDRFKNYKDFCTALGIEEKTGNAKISQIKEIERFIKINMDKRSFEILEIYGNPLKRIDKRSAGNNIIYRTHFEMILLDYLAKNKTIKGYTEVELTTHDILKLTGMCNENYINEYLQEYINIMKNHPRINRFNLNDFYRRTSNKFNEMIADMLSSLKTRCILLIKDNYKIHQWGVWRTATNEEEEIIIKTKREVMDKMGIEKIQDIYNKFLSKSFYEQLDQILLDRYYWDALYMVHTIGFSDTIGMNVERYKYKLSILMNEKSNLNKKILDYIDKDAYNKFDKNRRMIIELENGYTDNKKIFKLPDDYIEIQEALSELLIKL